jgi:hypothetical protein
VAYADACDATRPVRRDRRLLRADLTRGPAAAPVIAARQDAASS